MAVERLVIGCMTGTSCDGLDVALVRIRGRGLHIHAELIAAKAFSLGRLAGWLRRFAAQEPMTAGAIAESMHRFAALHLKAIRSVVGVHRPDLVVIHGQTVFHRPPVSWQMFQPQAVAAGLRAPVLYDLRQSDLAAGGQGAPITPLADWITLRNDRESRGVVNLGGFCNVTWLPAAGGPETVTGRDVCACNQVLDAAARAVLGQPFDRGGRSALRGTADDQAVADLSRLLARQARGRRSLGTGDEAVAWVAKHRERLDADDLMASAVAAVGGTIGRALAGLDRVLIAGGAVRNTALMQEIAVAAGCPVESSDTYGIPAAWREAMAMAVLGALVQDGVDITLTAVTRRPRPALPAGAWCLSSFPAARGTSLP